LGLINQRRKTKDLKERNLFLIKKRVLKTKTMMAGDDQEKTDDDKDLELDLMAEQELLRLTRQYRVNS